LHSLVRPIDVVAVAAVVVFVWFVALAQALVRPVPDAECASWADRHLGGESAYETYLEHRDAGGPAPAVQRLVAWIDSGARRSVGQLASMPGDVNLRKPLAVAAVALLLTTVLLQVPLQTTASVARTKAAATSAAASSELEPRNSIDAQKTDLGAGNDSASSVGVEHGDKTSSDGGRTPASADASGKESASREGPRGANAAPAAEQAAAGGRDAGQTADTIADTGFTEAWQGELATKMRELATTDQQPSAADPTLAADYQPATTPQDAAAMVVAFKPAAAVPPEARSRMRLDPAEQSYVRSYFADSGATP
jgi:cytoskeletal protein RodZ